MFFLLGVLLTNIYAQEVSANSLEGTTDSQAQSSQEIGFTVKSIPPETQIDQTKTFFYPLVKPGAAQELKLALTSLKADPVKIKVAIQNAQTSYLGDIEYVSADRLLSKNLKQPISELVSPEESELVLSNFETKILTLHVMPPEESFSGIKLGSIYLSEIDAESKAGISSNYAYNIGIILNEDREDYTTGNQLDFIDVYGTTRNGARGVTSVFENPQPLILEKLQIQTKITKKNETKVITEQTQQNMRMAPNSTLEYMTDWGIKDILPGEYTMHVEANSKTENWRWSKDFTISQKMADDINKSAAVSLVFPKYFFTAVLILSIMTILLLSRCLVLLRKSKGMSKDEV